MGNLNRLHTDFFDRKNNLKFPVYDLHGHMGEWVGISLPITGVDEMVERMKEKGINLLVFSHHSALLSPDIGNNASEKAVKKYPDRLRAYCVINPNYPEIVKEDLNNFENKRDIYLGLKFLADYHEKPLTHKNYERAWEYADYHQLPALIHTWGKSEYDGSEQVRKIAKKYNNVKMILAHSCHGEWEKAVELAQDFSSIYLDICAVIDERGVLDKFVKRLGSEKILFGTDFPWFGFDYYIGAVLDADINNEDKLNIFYKNAEQLIGDML
ncbi:MAG: amidohydrolase family protein [Bacillota bacterium]